MKTASPLKTVRLLMPQWQGGYDESPFPGQIYPLGARLLAWLAPASDAPLIEVPVAMPPPLTTHDKSAPSASPPALKDGGVFFRQALLHQARAARHILEAHQPDRVITFGGDCLISQSPFAYLNERYTGKVGLLWIDAHPDVTTPKDFDHAHAMVLGNLLGEGEPLLAAEVRRPYAPEQVLLVGVDRVLPHERDTLDRLGLRRVSSAEMMRSSAPVTDWIAQQGFERVAIHLDLDVMDPVLFRSLLFCNPAVQEHIDAEHGKVRLHEVNRLLSDVAACTEVVGMSFAEYMPWDALNVQQMLSALPFMK